MDIILLKSVFYRHMIRHHRIRLGRQEVNTEHFHREDNGQSFYIARSIISLRYRHSLAGVLNRVYFSDFLALCQYRTDRQLIRISLAQKWLL